MSNINFTRPIVIVGAPRSGTSLLQKIIREHPGFISVAKESGMIWQQYVSPELHDWTAETFDVDRITEATVTEIREKFSRYSMPAGLWTRAAALDIMRYQRSPLLAPLFRVGYKMLATLYSGLPKKSGDYRLVDKSVHSGLWLDFVDEVFPDALYIHIRRDGVRTVSSMVDCWLNPDRFFTYRLPEKIRIPGYPFDRWNFALPRGWRNWLDRPLEEVVAFQWSSIQESILEYFESPRFEGRTCAIKLEDLTGDTGHVLRKVADFAGLPWNDYFAELSRGLPVINARPERKGDAPRLKSPEAEEKVRPVMKRMGYE